MPSASPTAGVHTFGYRGFALRLPTQVSCTSCIPTRRTIGAAGKPKTASATGSLYIAPELIRKPRWSGGYRCRRYPSRSRLLQFGLSLPYLPTSIPQSGELSCAEIARAVATCLLSSALLRPPPTTIDLRQSGLVRDYLAAHAREQTPASILEEIAGIDRFTIAATSAGVREGGGGEKKQKKRAADGTGTLGPLALAQAAIASGQPLAQVAAEVGFATRANDPPVPRTYVLTPAAG